MAAKRNANDGSGRGVSVVHKLLVATTDTTALVAGERGTPTGFFSSEDGTLNIKCVDDPVAQLIDIAAHKDYIWSVEQILAGGSITLTNITLFWQ